MTSAPAIIQKPSPNFKALSSVKHGAVDHWIVGFLASADARFRQAGTTATQYGVGPSEIHQYVQDQYRAPGTGHNAANTNYISIEHEAGYLVDGVRFPGSAATLENSAQLHAHLARKHGWGKLVVGVNVFSHRDFVATECSGTLPIHWIVDRANEINGLPAAPTNPGANVISSGASAWGLIDIDAKLGVDYTKELQRQLGIVDDGDAGPITNGTLQTRIGAHRDSLFGTLSVKALQTFVGAGIDGEWGNETTAKTKAAIDAGRFRGAATTAPAPASTGKLIVDGQRGTLTIKAEQRALGVADDGLFWEQSIRAEQGRVGAHVDGKRGPNTIWSLQGYLGVEQDRIEGIETTKALQRRLNAGTF